VCEKNGYVSPTSLAAKDAGHDFQIGYVVRKVYAAWNVSHLAGARSPRRKDKNDPQIATNEHE